MNDAYYPFAVASVVLSSISIVLNLLVLIPNLPSALKLIPSSFLTLCMTLADFISSLCCFVIAVWFVKNGHGFESFGCQILGAIITSSCAISIALITFLSYFRYFVVVHNLCLSAKFAQYIVFYLAMTISLVMSMPFIMHVPGKAFSLNETQVVCVFNWFERDEIVVRAISWFCIVSTMVPVLSLAYVYYSIYTTVRQTNEECEEAVGNSANSSTKDQDQSQTSKTQKQLIHANKLREKTLLKQCVAIVATFMVTWAPYVILMVYQGAAGVQVPVEYEFSSQVLIFVNSACNPILIVVFDHGLRSKIPLLSSWTKITT